MTAFPSRQGKPICRRDEADPQDPGNRLSMIGYTWSASDGVEALGSLRVQPRQLFGARTVMIAEARMATGAARAAQGIRRADSLDCSPPSAIVPDRIDGLELQNPVCRRTTFDQAFAQVTGGHASAACARVDKEKWWGSPTRGDPGQRPGIDTTPPVYRTTSASGSRMEFSLLGCSVKRFGERSGRGEILRGLGGYTGSVMWNTRVVDSTSQLALHWKRIRQPELILTAGGTGYRSAHREIVGSGRSLNSIPGTRRPKPSSGHPAAGDRDAPQRCRCQLVGTATRSATNVALGAGSVAGLWTGSDGLTPARLLYRRQRCSRSGGLEGADSRADRRWSGVRCAWWRVSPGPILAGCLDARRVLAPARCVRGRELAQDAVAASDRARNPGRRRRGCCELISNVAPRLQMHE